MIQIIKKSKTGGKLNETIFSHDFLKNLNFFGYLHGTEIYKEKTLTVNSFDCVSLVKKVVAVKNRKISYECEAILNNMTYRIILTPKNAC